MERKEIEHRACLVERPTRETPDTFLFQVTPENLRIEAERFGLEVIDISYIRLILAAVADYLGQDATLVQSAACQGCGMRPLHHRSCSTLRHD